MRFIFITGIIFLFGFLFLPVGYLNNEILALVPLFTRDLSDKNIWEWQNAAAFVLTYFISVVLLIYFRIKDQKLGISIGAVINLVSLLIILAIIWMMEMTLSGSDTFDYSYGWVIWFAGFVLVVVDIYKKTGS